MPSPQKLSNMYAAAADLPGTWPWMVRSLIDDYTELQRAAGWVIDAVDRIPGYEDGLTVEVEDSLDAMKEALHK